jgi:phosphoribosylglycinamide formyltransferase 2
VRMPKKAIQAAQGMARKVTNHLGGYGLFGVEFFVRGRDVIFSELSPRPHDTGMVTLISQNLSEFDLHLRAVLGLPIPSIECFGPSASAVILADRESSSFSFVGVDKALRTPETDIKIFGKPSTRAYRRMGVALARGRTLAMARRRARSAARAVRIKYN